MPHPSRLAYRIAIADAALAVAYILFGRQPEMPDAFVRHAVTRTAPSSQTQDIPFTVNQPVRCFHVHCPLRGSADDLRIGIRGHNGVELLANLPARLAPPRQEPRATPQKSRA